jgi:hypothetical protein
MPSRAACALAAVAVAFGGQVASADPVYRDFSETSGIDFVHANGAKGDKQYCEVMGSGVCFIDYDGDGRQDLYFVTSVGPNRLYRNLGGLRFEDVTEVAGVGDESYGMGAIAGDMDGDGDADLFVTNFGPNRLLRNDGGRFTDVSESAGVADPGFGAGAAFFDANHDGWLDLYVANYVEQAVPDTAMCMSRNPPMRLYCPPRDYPPAQDRFYFNRGDGTFEDATDRAGIAGFVGRGLGVTVADIDRDGWSDVYVANDLNGNFLFRNLGDGRFEEIGVITGTSHSEGGMEQGGMGVAAEDYDNDGWMDLFVSNYLNETNSLYHNEGDGFFFDETASSGVGSSSLPYVGWGTQFLDFDLDGLRDLFVTNGHTESDTKLVDPTSTWEQPDFLFRNLGGGRFEDVTAETVPGLRQTTRAGRGAAFGDLDDDGDPEIVVNNQNGPPWLLENRTAGIHWIGFRTKGVESNRDGVGARVVVYAADLAFASEVRAGGSYLSGNDPRVLVGLGSRTAIDSVVVRWPSGAVDRHGSLPLDRYWTLDEGKEAQ